jgi:hypothetical protein
MAKLIYKATEYKRVNDIAYWTWLSPTNHLKIEIRASDDLGFVLRPGSDNEVTKEHFADRYELSGVLLPYQHVGLRWWRKDRIG